MPSEDSPACLVLELSKSESEKSLRPDSEMTDVAINDLCRKLLHSTADDSHEGVETRFTTNVADDFMVHTHPSTVSRILTHLFDNAQKFTEKGYIELRCEYDKAARQVRLVVEDTGVGINPGLAISQRLASSIGGEITLDAAYTNGCRFILSIPKL